MPGRTPSSAAASPTLIPATSISHSALRCAVGRTASAWRIAMVRVVLQVDGEAEVNNVSLVGRVRVH